MRILLLGTLLFSFPSVAFDCTRIHLTKVRILKNSLNAGQNNTECFAPNHPCFVEFDLGDGVTRHFPFLSPASRDEDNIGFSIQCESTNLSSGGGPLSLKLPPYCAIFLNFGKSATPGTQCVCEDDVCKDEDTKAKPKPQNKPVPDEPAVVS
jgi:hypothetical protein